jgi:subtilisin family serine protease
LAGEQAYERDCCVTLRIRPLIAAAALITGVACIAPAQAAAPTATYVVTLAPSASSPAVARLAGLLGGRVGHVYTDALNGFSVTLPTALAPALRALPGAVAVQRDQVVRALVSQPNPPSYGLDRIDQRALPLSSRFTTRANGAKVTAYVIDTGILYNHTDFGGRAVRGFDAITSGGGAVDCNGHGTHVAGTIGGKQHGVAKGVRLVGVRVLNCDGDGTTASVIAGVDWVTRHHRAGTPAVANMSLGGGGDAALDAAVKRAIADGITFGLAAGNDGGLIGDLLGTSDACNGSPARVPNALTVAATDDSDTRAGYSNQGSCVDLFAPGSDITSAWYTSPSATNTISGTSMATPHVVGVAALYLSSVGNRTPAQVSAQILGTATNGVVKSVGSGTPNKLLFTR